MLIEGWSTLVIVHLRQPSASRAAHCSPISHANLQWQWTFRHPEVFLGNWNSEWPILKLSHTFFKHKEYCFLDAASMKGKIDILPDSAWMLLDAHYLHIQQSHGWDQEPTSRRTSAGHLHSSTPLNDSNAGFLWIMCSYNNVHDIPTENTT